MAGFLGEISCKLDSKFRLNVPAMFIKQLPPECNDRFVINRGIEKCLTLYTVNEWNKVTSEMEGLNTYDPVKRKFLRQFFRGATEVPIDGQNRILLPKRLVQYAGLQKEVVLLGYFNRIEIWSSQYFDDFMDIDPEEFAELANKVMGDIKQTPDINWGEPPKAF